MTNSQPPSPLPNFNTQDLEGFKKTLDALLQEHLQSIDRMLVENSHFTWDNLMQPLENMDNELEKLWAPISHLHAVVNSDALRSCYEQCLPKLSAYESSIGHNQKLYDAIKSIDHNYLNATQCKIIRDALLNFELSGVNLQEVKKNRLEQIQARLSELSNQFENNVLDATYDFTLHIEDKAQLKGLPPHALRHAEEMAQQQEKPGFILNLEFPCYYAVVTHADSRQLRETIYHAYVTRASEIGPSAKKFDNGPIADEIVYLRHEKARLLDFNNFAEYSIATKMAESTKQVEDFLHDLSTRAHRQSVLEYDRLKTFARDHCNIDVLQPWDVAYVSEKKRKYMYDLSQESLRPWFPLSKVMDGMFAIIQRLYGMHIRAIEGFDTWHEDVRCYEVYDENDSLRGTLYADLFARANKRGGAWMDSLQSRTKCADGSIQNPIATLNCNFAAPSAGKEAYLNHDEVLTLFHEMGHCLHHVCTTVDYISASGINGVEWDAVELPSQFFENWCWDQSAIELLTEHQESKEPLPYDIFKQLLAGKNFQSAMAMMRQLEFSLFDFRLHKEFVPNQPGFRENILDNVRKQTTVYPYAEYNRFTNSFSHIFGGGYAAGYYSYKWAEVLSSDAFARFEEDGIFNPHTGRDFLHFILEVGGSQKALDAYVGFRGRKPNSDALLKHSGIK